MTGDVVNFTAVPQDESRRKEKFYEEIADQFEHVMNNYDLERRLTRMLAALPANLEGKSVLDGGCGPGFFSEALAKRGALVTSIDISPSLASIAARRAGGRGVACDIARLPFPDESFDVVLSSECIEHTVSPEDSFRSLARKLRRGGRMVLSVPNRRWIWSLYIAEKLGLRPYRGLENWVSWNMLSVWASNAGLSVHDHFGVHPLPFQLPFASNWLPYLEALAKPLDAWMVNQVIVAEKE